MLEHLTKEIQEVKENYTDHMTELFFLQVSRGILVLRNDFTIELISWSFLHSLYSLIAPVSPRMTVL